MKVGEEMSIGSRNKTAHQKIKESTNFILFSEKRKKANPTIPYIFVRIPTAIKSVAQKSCLFFTNV